MLCKSHSCILQLQITYAIMCLGKELQASKFQNLSKTPSSGIYWVFLFARKAGAGQANYRLLLLSSHLQIRWHTIPAITVTMNEASKSNLSPPFCYQYGAVTIYSISYHTSGFNNISNRYSLILCRNMPDPLCINGLLSAHSNTKTG